MKFLNKIKTSSLSAAILFFISGFTGGYFAGGGGIIITYVQLYFIPLDKYERFFIFPTTAALTLSLSAVNSVIYARSTDIGENISPLFILIPILGGILGGFFYGKFKYDLLRSAFAVLTIVSGILTIIR